MAFGVGLTGGIGSGKSTVAELLVEHGAVLIDADRIAREVVEPGRAAYGPLLAHFGARILAADGTIDRAALAAVAFSDPDELAALNAITHPAIGVAMVERRQAEAATDHIVVSDVPLLRPVHRELLSLDLVVVVDCPVDVAVERLVSQRGFDRADAEKRVAAQVSREERCEGADVVIDNAGDLPALVTQVDVLWRDLEARAAAKGADGSRGSASPQGSRSPGGAGG